MSRYRIWIIIGLAALAWLLVLAVTSLVWHGVERLADAVPVAASGAPVPPA